MTKLIHYVIDLETTGVSPGCGVLAIGVAPVDKSNHFQFYGAATIRSNKEAGLSLNEETMNWWRAKERENLLAEFLDPDGDSISELLFRFSKWLLAIQSQGDIRLWGNGAVFDWGILEHAAWSLGINLQIDSRKIRCYRTMKESFSVIKKPPFVGTPHYALDDAINEAAHLNLILNRIESCLK